MEVVVVLGCRVSSPTLRERVSLPPSLGRRPSALDLFQWGTEERG
jgi:hypothetical protein